MHMWSTLAKIIYKRTYARNNKDSWEDTVDRVVSGNLKGFTVSKEEEQDLRNFMLNRKAMPAGRGLWFSGTTSHEILGGIGLNNCYGLVADDWNKYVIAQDLLMLGGGVGLSVEHKYVSKLPKVKKSVKITHIASKDADFIMPDSREGWNEMTRRALESFFVTGKSFSYSTICIRGAGEEIKGFGGVSSGPMAYIKFIENLSSLLKNREGRHIRPIDAGDIICTIAEFVVSGNVRRSAILLQGDAFDKDFLRAKRWDLGTLPSYRAFANFSVVADDIEDLHPEYWKTYEAGEAFGIVNRTNIQKYGRMGELKKDGAVVVNPCGEANLEDGEACNLQEIFLPNIESVAEFKRAARLMHRWGKRVSCERAHHGIIQTVTHKNRRVGMGITGCLQAPQFFTPNILDEVYKDIQIENEEYSSFLDIPESIKTTVVKPSGTLSLLGDCTPGIHPAFSRHSIRRIRIASNDSLISTLRNANHYMEPVQKFDGTLDHSTQVVDFYQRVSDETPCADEGFDTWKQLETLLFTQKHWADQSVSISVYYKREEISKIKEWLLVNLKNIKAISFLCYNEHGFKQAPLEAITQEQYESFTKKIKAIEDDNINMGDLESLECVGGFCPVK